MFPKFKKLTPHNKLWLNAIGLGISLVLFKQIIWIFIKEKVEIGRSRDHQRATEHLQQTYTEAKFLADQLKPLSEEKKKRIIAKVLEDLRKEEADAIKNQNESEKL